MTLPERASRVHSYTDVFGPKNEIPDRIFLDANVVIDIFENAVALQTATNDRVRGRRRHPELMAFLARARSGQAKLLVTVGVLEEVYHVYTRIIIDGIKVAGDKPANEKKFRDLYPKEYAQAKSQALMFTNKALNEVCKYARVVAPSGWLGDKEIALGEKQCECFLELLQLCHEIGGKDALHVVQARMMNCNAFVSRDGDFKCIPGIVLFCRDP
jgi:predicted nucleic acid-binding protein